MTQKKRELLKNPTKIEESQEKKFIDRNWTITTCLLRDSNPDYQCVKITSCRWRPPPRMHSFTATTHFKSSPSFVSSCVCCMLCTMRQSRIVQSMQLCIFHIHGSVHRNSLLIRSNRTQQYAGIYLLQNYSNLATPEEGFYPETWYTRMTCTRSCSYSFMCFWWWVRRTPETCRVILH